MIGNILKAYRLERGITQKSLLKTLDVSKAQLSKIESGIHVPEYKITMNILKLVIPGFDNTLDLLQIKPQDIIMKQNTINNRQTK